MYHFVCFILLVSLEGLKAHNVTTTSQNSTPTFTNASVQATTPRSSTKNSDNPPTDQIINKPTMKTNTEEFWKKPDCLFNLTDSKEMLLWAIISCLAILCVFLPLTIGLFCKCCRNDGLGVKKSAATTRRNNAYGRPSETDIMLKDHSSVKVDIEFTLDESPEPEGVGEADGQVGIQVSSEENKNLANDTSPTAPTQGVDQPGKIDLKMEDLEKVE